MPTRGFWNFVRARLMPALVSIAAIAVTVAAAVFVADTLREDRSDRDGREGPMASAALTPADARAPSPGEASSLRDDGGEGGEGAVGLSLADLDIGSLLAFLASLGLGAPDDGAVLGVRAEESPDGVVVRAVSPRGAADDAGVAAGDVILSVGGTPTATVEEVLDALDAVGPGDEYVLEVRRGGATESLTAQRDGGGSGDILDLIARLLEWLTGERGG